MSRIRANNITNQAGNGAPNAPHGLVVTGILTATGNVSIGGTVTYEDVTNIDSIGIITARTGIHIDDSIAHIGDTNTKIRFPSADTITAETGGTEKLRITGIGSVGIGTQNPANKLEVGGVISATDLFVTSGGDTTSNNISGKFSHGGINSKSLVIAADPNDVGANTRLQFDVDGAEKVRIEAASNDDGKIGINSTSPDDVISANSSLLNSGISYNCDNSPFGSTNLRLTLSGKDNGSHYFRFGYSDNMHTRGMIQYYRPNSALAEDELRFWVGGSEKIRFTSTGGIGIATVGDGSTNGSIGVGSTGQVLTSQGPGYPSIWKGGSTRILEQISSPCTGESVMTSFGPRVIQDAGTAGYQLSTTHVDITGSVITYRPPTGTHTVIYKFMFQVSQHDANAIAHFRFYIGSDEILWARHTHRGDYYQNRAVFEWPIRIDPSQATNLNHARLQSWNSDLVLKMTARDYSTTYDAKLHMVNNWDGTGTDMFSMPTISITALGS